MKNLDDVVSYFLKKMDLKSKVLMMATTIFFFSGNALAIKISDYSPYNYEVSFTNPICQEYLYEKPLESKSGKFIKGKPKNAYCRPGDFLNVDKQKNNPHHKILQLIRDPKTKEIFMAYLSFSKKTVIDELCEAIKKRNIKFTLVVDENNRKRGMELLNSLAQCPNLTEQKALLNYPQIVTRGQSGRGKDRIGFAHNKLILINASQKDETRKIVFSSGNMSNGTTTHHENWHFLTTSSKSYFFQVHLCLKDGLLNHYASKSVFAEFMKGCRSKITVPEESDIKAFFVPAEGERALEVLKASFENARTVRMATHRFSNKKIISFMSSALKEGTEVKLLLDDDLYWIGKMRRAIGRNTFREFVHVDNLVKEGLKAQYIETYADSVVKAKKVQLQHNKFFIFDGKDGTGSVFTGAGNITNSAFEKNFENFYLIKIPYVYVYFRLQYLHLWFNLGTSAEEMPTTFVLP